MHGNRVKCSSRQARHQHPDNLGSGAARSAGTDPFLLSLGERQRGELERAITAIVEIAESCCHTIPFRTTGMTERCMMTDAKKEALEAMAAKRAKDEAAWRRDNVGKVRFYLVNASDDPPTSSTEGQIHLRSVIAALKENKIEADAPFLAVDSVDAVGGYTGEIAVLASAFGPVLTGILCAWLQSKAGRKVRLKECSAR
jgi:hypothetical protein